MKTLVFDVMLDGRFVHTFRYRYCPLFPIDEQELEKFVTDRLPTLKRKGLMSIAKILLKKTIIG